MPVVNIGLQRTRDLVRGSGSMNQPVNSLGFGTNDSADNAADVRLGAGAGAKSTSFWKTVTPTAGGDGTSDPWVQYEATFAEAEANDVIGEIGTSAGSLTGTNPAGNDGTRLYTRKKIGPLTKTTDIELIGRVRITY